MLNIVYTALVTQAKLTYCRPIYILRNMYIHVYISPLLQIASNSNNKSSIFDHDELDNCQQVIVTTDNTNC